LNSLTFLLTLFSLSSLLIPIVIWILSIREPGITLSLFFFSLLLLTLQELLMLVFYVVYNNNLVVANYATLPVLFTIYLAYYLHRDFTPPVRRVIGITGMAGLVSIVVILATQEVDTFLNILQFIFAGSLVLLAIYYFVHKVFFTTQFEISKHALFYISAALLFYYFTSIAITSSYSFMPPGSMLMWNLKLIAYIFYNIVVGYGFYIFSRYRLAL
jgi:hypothetical protein